MDCKKINYKPYLTPDLAVRNCVFPPPYPPTMVIDDQRNWKEIEQKISFSLKDKTDPQCRLKFLIFCSHPKIYNHEDRQISTTVFWVQIFHTLVGGYWPFGKNITLRFWGLIKTGRFFEKSMITYQSAPCHNAEGHNVKLRRQKILQNFFIREILLGSILAMWKSAAFCTSKYYY